MAQTKMTGGCQCGAIHYEIEGELPPAYCCHCGECKKQSASAFSMSIAIPFERLKVKGRAGDVRDDRLQRRGEALLFLPALRHAACGTARPPIRAMRRSRSARFDHGEHIVPTFHLWVSREAGGGDPRSAIFRPTKTAARPICWNCRERMSGKSMSERFALASTARTGVPPHGCRDGRWCCSTDCSPAPR